MAQSPQKQKRVPLRRCSGCGESFPKPELLRVLRLPDGSVCLDFTGKKSGRGAYICKKAACLRAARKSKRIEHSLETAIPDEIYDKMTEELLKNGG